MPAIVPETYQQLAKNHSGNDGQRSVPTEFMEWAEVAIATSMTLTVKVRPLSGCFSLQW